MIKIKRPKGKDGKPMSDEELRAKMTAALDRMMKEAGIEPGDKGKTWNGRY